MDRDSGTKRQGHNHRDWDERQEQVQTKDNGRPIGTG